MTASLIGSGLFMTFVAGGISVVFRILRVILARC